MNSIFLKSAINTVCSLKMVLLLFFLASAGFIHSQNEIGEILRLNKLADSLENEDPLEAKKAATKALEIGAGLKNDTLMYKSRFRLAIANFNLSNFNQALPQFIENFEWAKKHNKKNSIVSSLNAIANTYKNMGRNESAIDTYKEALKYTDSKNIALNTLIKSNMIGLLRVLKQYDTSLIYCYQVLDIIQKYKSKDPVFISNMYGDLLFNYMALNNKDSIRKYLDTTLALKKASGDVLGLASYYHNIASFYADNNDPKKAEMYFNMAIAIPNDNYELIFYSKKQLADLLFTQKRFEEASKLYSDCFVLKDSITNIQTMEKLSELEVKYETGKKEEELKRMGAEKEVADLKAEQSRLWLWLTSAGILFVLIAVVVLFKQNQNRKLANKLLQHQNDEIIHQKKEITDSINYAKRIQLAILPPDKMVKRLLPNSFVFYKPKDVVSGDFYWVEEKNGTIMFAAVDCTGHGVPGAMMSVVGLNLLNQAVKEKGLTKPSEILQHLDTGVTETLRQSGDTNSIKDGMDLSLCSYNPKTFELQYAGAFNNLWVVRDKISSTYRPKNANEVFFEEHLLEVKADKFPIGSNLDGVADNYTNHKIQLQKGDCVYLYSDGFADQFGGPRGKKFKYNYLKKLLVSVRELPPDEQREKLLSTIENWRGNLDQVDDILVIGVCI